MWCFYSLMHVSFFKKTKKKKSTVEGPVVRLCEIIKETTSMNRDPKKENDRDLEPEKSSQCRIEDNRSRTTLYHQKYFEDLFSECREHISHKEMKP